MYNDVPPRVLAVIESNILVGDAIAALDAVEGDEELQRLVDALQCVYDNQAAFLDACTWGASPVATSAGADVPA